jgi:hypothetical protein
MTLRVGVVVPSAVVEAWKATLVERLAGSGFDVQTYLEASAPPRRSPWAFRAYERLDARVFRAERDALEPVTLTAKPLAALDDPDVVVHLGRGDRRGFTGAARYGVWSLRVPPLFWELHTGTPYRTTLEAELRGGQRRLLYDCRGRPDRTSLHRSRNQAYWKAQGAVLRALESLRDRGGDYLDSRPLAGETDPDEPPGTSTVLRHVTRISRGVLARRLKKLVAREEWLVAARSAGATDWRRVAARPGEDLADPFLLEHDGAAYVFCERIEAGAARGTIACARLDGSTPLATVLARQYHLSYPFVFTRGDETYMIPESLENESVDLYRAVDFPSHWALEARLLSGVRAVDATLLEHASRLWLFVNLAEPGASVDDELHLFTATDLAGPWAPHRENPVVADVGRARPAGRVFRRDDQLIRPAQDCSRGYGRAVVLNRIDVLTPEEYRETPVDRIEPSWSPGLVGTHTYNSTPHAEVIDGFRYVRRRW